jgi:hypothetical protein
MVGIGFGSINRADFSAFGRIVIADAFNAFGRVDNVGGFSLTDGLDRTF